MTQTKTIQEIKTWRNSVNLYSGNSIISELGYRMFQDLLASGRIEKTNILNDGSGVYKYNQ